MDKAQFRNWYDFADRMARQARPGLSGTTKARLVRTVGRLIQEAVTRHGLDAFEDWDAHPYPCDLFEDMLVRDGMMTRAPGTGDAVGELGYLALCCIRAGFDVGVAPSAGVAGADFTVGMIQRMYPDGLPEFVEHHFEATGTDIANGPPSNRVWL